ncbi:MAG: Cna B-type domain-containing protein, partial [Erysipelotrichaceae bacterium]|nr:Cna B-type domain-containing protein [Erysipelotrichaceae bacterium]
NNNGDLTTTYKYEAVSGTGKFENGIPVFDDIRDAYVIITGTKALADGTAPADGAFRFELYENNSLIDVAYNYNGKFVFGKIKYQNVGETHTYTIKEKYAGMTANGYTYDGNTYDVTVTTASSYTGGVNYYTATPTGNDPTVTNEKLCDITVNKDWAMADGSNIADSIFANGNTPASITIYLKHIASGNIKASAALTNANNYSYTFTNLPGTASDYEVIEDPVYVNGTNVVAGYTFEYADGKTITLHNKLSDPGVALRIVKKLEGATISAGQFKFEVYESTGTTKLGEATNDAGGNVIFTNLPTDKSLTYIVREVQGTDPRITYYGQDIVVNFNYDNINGTLLQVNVPDVTNYYHPILLRLQKTSKDDDRKPLQGAVYSLWEHTAAGDVMVEDCESDANGYMTFKNVVPNKQYFFKEVKAPAGHEVDPYATQRFMIQANPDGTMVVIYYDENWNEINRKDANNELIDIIFGVADIVDKIDPASTAPVVITYTDAVAGISATATADAGVLPADAEMVVTKLTGAAEKAVMDQITAAVGQTDEVVAYDVKFYAKGGVTEIQPSGNVTVTINSAVALPQAQKDQIKNKEMLTMILVHVDKNGAVETVSSKIAVDTNTDMTAFQFTEDTFSPYVYVIPTSADALANLANGVADFVSKVSVAKIDTQGKYLVGARLEIKDMSGNVLVTWDTGAGPESFKQMLTAGVPLNVDTKYILHEVSAPKGYNLADDIIFSLNSFDSSITVWKADGTKDEAASAEWTTSKMLTMVDVPLTEQVIEKRNVITQPNEVIIRVPNTGDDSNLMLVGMIAMASLAGMAFILLLSRRKKA